MVKKQKEKIKKGVSPSLLQKCAGTDLDKHRLAPRDNGSYVEPVIYGKDGKTEEVEQWLKSNKKNLNA